MLRKKTEIIFRVMGILTLQEQLLQGPPRPLLPKGPQLWKRERKMHCQRTTVRRLVMPKQAQGKKRRGKKEQTRSRKKVRRNV